jgi:tRNA (guanine6-N2)-methyltransferase
MAARRKSEKTTPPCYAMVFHGLEEVTSEEIEQELGGDIRKTSPGIVIFRVDEIDKNVLNLRTAEDVFLFAWGSDELTLRAVDLEKIESWTARNVPWEQLLRIHHAIRPKPKGKPSYRLITQMIGEHGYLRTDARAALARGLSNVFPSSWRYAEENASVEVWLTIWGTTAICGVRLSDRKLRHRDYKAVHRPASLRPTIAASMVRLANLRAGMSVLDPMCGVGTILAETLERRRIANLKPLSLTGGDVELEAIRAAGPNLRGLGTVYLQQWDARALPLADDRFDRIITNPPFGKQLGTPESIGPLYRQALREFDRVLKPAGKAVLLVSEFAALKSACSVVSWKLEQSTKVRVLGQGAILSVWRKPDVRVG